MPANIQTSFADEDTLTGALDAAFDPDVSSAPHNTEIMNEIYGPIVTKVTDATTTQIEDGLTKAADAAKQAAADQVAAGELPAAAQPAAEAAAVAQAQQAAAAQIQQQIPVAQIADDGTVTLDFSNDADREAFVAALVPTLQDQFRGSGDSSGVGSGALDDTSFLTGATPALTKPILVAFNASAVLVYRVAMWVVIVAFVLSLFFRTPPLRAKSALQEAADDAALAAKRAADNAGALVEPDFVGAKTPN
jgi:hypothetical protein